MGAIAVHRQGIAPMGRSCSLGSARDTAPYGSPAHCRASLHGDPGMLESVQPDPTSFCAIDSPIDGRSGGTPGQPRPHADTIPTSLRVASLVSRQWHARDIVPAMDDRPEEHTTELQSLTRKSYPVYCS